MAKLKPAFLLLQCHWQADIKGRGHPPFWMYMICVKAPITQAHGPRIADAILVYRERVNVMTNRAIDRMK